MHAHICIHTVYESLYNTSVSVDTRHRYTLINIFTWELPVLLLPVLNIYVYVYSHRCMLCMCVYVNAYPKLDVCIGRSVARFVPRKMKNYSKGDRYRPRQLAGHINTRYLRSVGRNNPSQKLSSTFVRSRSRSRLSWRRNRSTLLLVHSHYP